MCKRLLDLIIGFIGLVITSPIMCIAALAICLEDRGNPFYVSARLGKNGKPFRFYKMRSMKIIRDTSGPSSTADDDPRLTHTGRLIRKLKFDEFPQFINVLKGNMSIVGPRANLATELDNYTENEKALLLVRPGITDFASIVFSDEGEILKGKPDPDAAYHTIIRPWKSRLGLLYIEKQSLWVDLNIILLTAIALFNRKRALKGVAKVLRSISADSDLIDVTLRTHPLEAYHFLNESSETK